LTTDPITALNYVHSNQNAGYYVFYLYAVYEIGDSEIVSAEVTLEEIIVPVFVTELGGNYPNPFNPETNIRYSLEKAGNVSIEIFNIRGQRVKSLLNAMMNEGEHTVVWDGRDDDGRQVGSGMYLYIMKADGYTAVMRMTLMK